MSEQERMDRAERIRQMREGRRSGDDADEPDQQADDGAAATPDDEATPAPTEQATEATAEADAQAAAADADAAGDAMSHVDDAVADAVERVSGTSASVPSPDQMGDGTAESGDESSTADQAADEADADSAESEETTEVGAAARAGVAGAATTTEPETRVLEFTLDGEQYCLDIEYIEEIVKRDGVTRVPNTPEFVEGVVDLRGQITTILNPKVIIGTDDQARGELLLVFDAEEFDEQGHLGWVVDDVRQVSPVSDDEVNDPPVDDEHVEGVIDRGEDEQFVVWTSPDLALDGAT